MDPTPAQPEPRGEAYERARKRVERLLKCYSMLAGILEAATPPGYNLLPLFGPKPGKTGGQEANHLIRGRAGWGRLRDWYSSY